MEKHKILPNSYLTGVLLGINAIQDAYLWVDSPDCFFMKVDNIELNHDLNSTLRKPNGEHRILSTISDVDNVIDNRNSSFVKTLSNMASKDYTNLIFVSSMPMSQVVGADYDGLINIVREEFPQKNIFNVPSRSMTDCWLEGYSDLLFSLSKNIDISGSNPGVNKVAIVGNMFDRNEGDCKGNVIELKNIFESLGIKVVSVWLEGGNFDEILKVKEASTIISLPYGRKAAKKIANRLGIDLLELDIPFGLNKTIAFINKVGEYFNLEKEKIEGFIKKELIENGIGIIKHVVREEFIGKKISYYGDPFLIDGIIDFSNTLGLEILEIYINGSEKHIKNNLEYKVISEVCGGNFSNDIDLIISIRNNGVNIYDGKILEFSFPSYFYHVFTNNPYYGIKGGMNFINRIYNKILTNKNEK
nr:nitrogenase component 1 [Candidatus Gracilibacteria bacterium]